MMQHGNAWYVGYTGPWNPIQPPGGVAPSRADLALARYLEKKAADSADADAPRSETRPVGAAILAFGRVWVSRLIAGPTL